MHRATGPAGPAGAAGPPGLLLGVRPVLPLVAVVLLTTALAGCSRSLLGSTAPTGVPVTTAPQSTSTTTPPLRGEVAVAFPVAACNGPSGSSGSSAPTRGSAPGTAAGWQPSILLAPIPTSLVGKVTFYSDGVHTVVAPIGWTCSAVAAGPGPAGLAVYPSNDPNPPINGSPAPGTEGVFASFDATGHTTGVALVCPFFTLPSWQTQAADCAPVKPAGEQTTTPTPDVTAVTDPAGVVGSLAGSGGQFAVTGTVIFPQVQPAVTDGASLPVAVESCAMEDPSLCPTVLSDFEVREFPTPVVPGP